MFTAALFLSGYVLQQKTVRDIRIAIRPHGASAQDQMYMPSHGENSRIQVQRDLGDEVLVNMKQNSVFDSVNTKSNAKSKRALSPTELDTNTERGDRRSTQSDDSQVDDEPQSKRGWGKSSRKEKKRKRISHSVQQRDERKSENRLLLLAKGKHTKVTEDGLVDYLSFLVFNWLDRKIAYA